MPAPSRDSSPLGWLEEVWTPDERTRALRRLTNRRERLVRERTRAKDEAHGVLARNLCERPPVTDAFGKGGWRWLAQLELPADERLTLDGCLRQVDFLDAEVAALDAEIAKQALAWPEVLRLMSVPGVNVQTAAAFMASPRDVYGLVRGGARTQRSVQTVQLRDFRPGADVP